MEDVSIRPEKLSDAEPLFRILHNHSFPKYYPGPETLVELRESIKRRIRERWRGTGYSYTILYQGKIVGGCGIGIIKGTGRIGYYVGREFWGRGIASEAVRQLQVIGFNKLRLRLMWMSMDVRNKASERVAIKSKFKKRGLRRRMYRGKYGFQDHLIYFKGKNRFWELGFRLTPISWIR